MTGIRYAVSVAEESTFGVKGTDYFVLPPGAYMSATYNVATETVYAPGSKLFEDVVYGRVSGSFEISCNLSYEHLGIFRFLFEDYKPEAILGEDGKTPTGLYRHTFRKANNKRIGSFTIRRRTLNKITSVDAGDDETTYFLGCVLKSCRISQASGSGKMTATFSGYFSDTNTVLGELKTNGYKEFEGQNVEWSCMFIGDKYVANVESLTLSIDNGSGMQYTTCKSTSVNYYESTSAFQFGMTCYSNNFERYKALVYSGGQDPSVVKNGNVYKNMCKNKHPIPQLSMRSFNTCHEDTDADLSATIDRATKSLTFNIEKCVVKSATWQKGDGSRMLDQMSSAECRKIEMVVVNNIPSYSTVPTTPYDHTVS